MAQPATAGIRQRLPICPEAAPDDVADLVLECLRRCCLAIGALGSNEESLRIAAVLVLGEHELHSTTLLLNETGLARTTLVRHLARFIEGGLVIQVIEDGCVSYIMTPAGAQLGRDATQEMIDVVSSRRIGFSSALQRRLRAHGFRAKPAAQTLAFPKLPHLSKVDTHSVDPIPQQPRAERRREDKNSGMI